MKAGKILAKTMPYVWAKLLLSMVTVVIAVILFALVVALPMSSGITKTVYFLVPLWVSLVGIIRMIIMHYIGYMFKVGHIAVMTEAIMTGQVPEKQLSYGLQRIKERFLTANVYFVVDKLVSGAVKQIQNGIGRLGNAFRAVPGMGTITGLLQMLIGIYLGYVDECCLGYTFHKKEQGAFKSAADGVAIFAQNWKTLLASAAKTMALVIFGLFGISLVLFAILLSVFNALGWSGWVALFIAILLSLAVKHAFVDSFILARTMVAYMKVAPTTVITFDLYGKLSSLSGKFKKLWTEGKNEAGDQPGAGDANYSQANAGYAQNAYAGGQQAYGGGQQGYAQNAYAGGQQVYCVRCGSGNNVATRFCARCGHPMAAMSGGAGA